MQKQVQNKRQYDAKTSSKTGAQKLHMVMSRCETKAVTDFQESALFKFDAVNYSW